MSYRPSHEAAATYNDYYGFQHPPFSLTPDPQFMYPSPSHERTMQTILHALGRREGLIMVTGDIGCGKTTLCRRLLQLLPPRTFLSLVVNPFLAADDLLKEVLENFGLVTGAEVRGGPLTHASCHELARILQEFLGSLADLDASAVIIVDEAQNLPLRTLEQIRLLSNFETDTAKQLQIILVGQRNLEPILALEEMRQLDQRISRRCRLEPLSVQEVTAYIEYRLSVARGRELPGADVSDAGRVRFTPSALRAVARLSGGVPRIINLLCDRALEIAQSGGAMVINRRLVMAAAKDLEFPVPATVRFTALRPIATGVACAALVAGVSLGSWKIGKPPALSSAPSAPRIVEKSSSIPSAGAEASLPTAERAPSPPPAASTLPPPAPPSSALPEPASAPITSVVTAAPSFDLVVASFETAGHAGTTAANLIGRGYPARVAESGRWQVVIVGPYSSPAEAEQARQALTKMSFTGVKVLASN